MASALLAFLAVCGFHICSAGVIQDGLTIGKYINHKHINKYKYLKEISRKEVHELPKELKVAEEIIIPTV